MNSIKKSTIKIKGKAQGYFPISVTISGKTFSAKVNNNSNYTLYIKKQKKGTIITVKAKDNSGNIFYNSTIVK